MNWEMTTALAEIFGMLGLVASLLYVAYQMKLARQQRTVESYHAALDEVDDFAKLMAEDHANSEIWWRANKGLEKLTDAERVRYFAMLFILFRSWEKAFHYHAEGGLQDWSAQFLVKAMADFTMGRGLQEYWALRKRWYTPDFQEWVDNKIKERSGVDVYGEQFRIFGSADVKPAPQDTQAG
jgi:hypothetical protein